MAEYMVADARLVAPKPRSLGMREAAALPPVSITAWDAPERCQLTAADHILVHGGIRGVGHVAVQLARAIGARVATTVRSSEAAAVAKALGATETIDFHDEKVEAYVDRLTAGRDSHFTLATAPDAQRRLESGKARGKIVIDIAGN